MLRKGHFTKKSGLPLTSAIDKLSRMKEIRKIKASLLCTKYFDTFLNKHYANWFLLHPIKSVYVHVKSFFFMPKRKLRKFSLKRK